MSLQRVTGMPEQPHTCLLCGQGPTLSSGEQRQSIFAEGVDVDWGNSVYICWDCAEIIADLVGRATRFGFDELTEKYEELEGKHNDLLVKYEEQEDLLDKIREGTKAQKRIRETSKA